MNRLREESSTTNGKSFQDDALKEEATLRAPSSFDRSSQGFRPESISERREVGKDDAFNKENGAQGVAVIDLQADPRLSPTSHSLPELKKLLERRSRAPRPDPR